MPAPDMSDSPNPPFAIGIPENEDPDTLRARLFQYHRANGSLGDYYAMYPDDAPRSQPERQREREL